MYRPIAPGRAGPVERKPGRPEHEWALGIYTIKIIICATYIGLGTYK